MPGARERNQRATAARRHHRRLRFGAGLPVPERLHADLHDRSEQQRRNRRAGRRPERGAVMASPSLQPTIYDLSVPGRTGVTMPASDVPETALPADLLRAELDMPEVSELQVVRHFTNLSHLNHSIDEGFYPLGSCTMKYNPKINEDMARLAGFAQLHPMSDEAGSQGALALMHTLQSWLAEIAGMD